MNTNLQEAYEVEWNATGLPSGIYFYQLKTERFVANEEDDSNEIADRNKK